MLKKRILIDCTDVVLSNKNTGIQRVVKKLYTHLKNISEKQNFKVTSIYIKKDKAFKINIEELSDSTHNNNPKSPTLLKNLLRSFLEKCLIFIPYNFTYFVYRKISERKVSDTLISEEINFTENDIIILADASWRMNIWKCLEKAKNTGTVIVPVIHDLIPIYHKEFVRKCYSKIFRKWITRLYNISDSFICISEHVKNDLINFYKACNLEVQNKQFNSFILGADFKLTKINHLNISQELLSIYQKNKSIYLIVSTIEPKKNHKYLLNVFDELWKKGIDVCLCIVGKDSGLASKTISRIKKHVQLNKKLFMFNYLNDDEVMYCYKNAKAFLFPSITEGFGLPIIESLSLSLPVFASDIPVFREIGKDNINYFSLDNISDLVKKIQNFENREYIKNSDPICKSFYSWEESSEQLLNIILENNKIS